MDIQSEIKHEFSVECHEIECYHLVDRYERHHILLFKIKDNDVYLAVSKKILNFNRMCLYFKRTIMFLLISK